MYIMQPARNKFLVILLGILIQHKITLASEFPFFDVTEALNKKDDTEIQNALNMTRTLYYSTDELLTNILYLSWIPKLIIKNFPTSEEVGFCFVVSFQIAKDKNNINWKYMQDIFYNLPESNNTKNQESLQILRKHICKIVLNFEADFENQEYQSFESYTSEASISFTKYTKKILHEIFGPEKVFPVGVLYSESQIITDTILLEQEIKNADFVIFTAHLTPMSKMPYLFPQFEEHLTKILTKNEEYLTDVQAKTGKNIHQSSMIIWDKYVLPQTSSSEWERLGNQNILSSEPTYLEFLQNFITSAVRRRKGNIEVISNTIFDLQNREIDFDQDRSYLKGMIPYFYVQESDINACMMIRLLLHISQFGMESLAVNEFTWSAIVRYKENLTNVEFAKETCGCSIETVRKAPQNILLFVSKLTSMHWDQMGNVLKILLADNTRVGDMNLTTVIIPVNELGYSVNSDMKNFFNGWVTSKIVRMGCQLDVSNQVFKGGSEGIIGYTERKCQPILHISNVIVWQIDVSSRFISAYKFSFDFGEGSLKRGLFRMLAERDIYNRRRSDKEVMFRIITRYLKSNGSCAECDHNVKMKEMEFRQSVAIWANIHKVRIIFTPAFDLKNKLNSLFEFPRQNDDGSFDRCIFTF